MKGRQKILITGASGFVGGQCTQHLANKGFQVIATGRRQNPKTRLNSDCEYVPLDFVKDEIPKFDLDVCIHSAGATKPGMPEEYYRMGNEIATQRLVDSIQCKKFIYISSASVYPSSHQPLTEERASLDYDISNYGKSKLRTELLLRNFYPLEKLTILRPRAIYGIHDTVLLPRILRLKRFNTLFLPGNCKIVTSMTNINNLLSAIFLVLEKNKTNSHVYNIADKELYTLRNVIVSLHLALSEKQIKLLEIPLPFLKVMARLNSALNIKSNLSPQTLTYLSEPAFLSIDRAERELGFSTSTNFFQKLPEIAAWYKSQL